MSEKPILFSTEMVKAILANRKTMTRRVIKPQPVKIPDDFPYKAEGEEYYWASRTHQSMIHFQSPAKFELGAMLSVCPYGQVGDKLWVRETFYTDNYRTQNNLPVIYKADGDIRSWKPSIFMPKWACRLWLEITDVRVERIQDITEDDAIAEGIPAFSPNAIEISSTIPRQQFFTLWNSINEKRGYGWDSNCWVWVISFKRIDK